MHVNDTGLRSKCQYCGRLYQGCFQLPGRVRHGDGHCKWALYMSRQDRFFKEGDNDDVYIDILEEIDVT